MRNHESGKSNLATMAVLFAVASLALVATHGDASACGGLFCNARPPDPFAPLPVAQNGENVVFSITKDPAGGAPTLQAHIQILYTGDAAKFSWVVPVDAAPTLSTGTDRLFAQLASATAPRFTTSPVTRRQLHSAADHRRHRRLIRWHRSGGHDGLGGQHRRGRRGAAASWSASRARSARSTRP